MWRQAPNSSVTVHRPRAPRPTRPRAAKTEPPSPAAQEARERGHGATQRRQSLALAWPRRGCRFHAGWMRTVDLDSGGVGRGVQLLVVKVKVSLPKPAAVHHDLVSLVDLQACPQRVFGGRHTAHNQHAEGRGPQHPHTPAHTRTHPHNPTHCLFVANTTRAARVIVAAGGLAMKPPHTRGGKLQRHPALSTRRDPQTHTRTRTSTRAHTRARREGRRVSWVACQRP